MGGKVYKDICFDKNKVNFSQKKNQFYSKLKVMFDRNKCIIDRCWRIRKKREITRLNKEKEY
jgi:hypothetical protein